MRTANMTEQVSRVQKRPAPIPAATQIEMLRQAKKAARYVAERIPGVDPEDVAQEVLLMSLPAAGKFDPSHKQAGYFFIHCVDRQIWPKINRQLASVSISKADSRAGNLGAALQGVALKEAPEQTTTNPEDALLLKERRHAWFRGRVKLRREIMARTRSIPEAARDLGLLVLGIDGDGPMKIAGAGRRLGLDARTSQKLYRKFREALGDSPEVELLHQRLELDGIELGL